MGLVSYSHEFHANVKAGRRNEIKQTYIRITVKLNVSLFHS